MKTYFILIAVSIIVISSCAVSKNTSTPVLINQQVKDAGNNDMLMGRCTRDALLKPPFSNWLKPNYDSYVVDSFTCNFIKPCFQENPSLFLWAHGGVTAGWKYREF